MTLRPTADGWPKKLELHLKLSGLEGLSLESERWRVKTFFGDKSPEVFERRNGKWEAGKDDASAAPVIRKEDGAFVIEIPAAWLDKRNKLIKVEWVDFYR